AAALSVAGRPGRAPYCRRGGAEAARNRLSLANGAGGQAGGAATTAPGGQDIGGYRGMTISISPIDRNTRVRDWLAVPHTVFAGDDAFVPQLDFMEKQRIDPGHAPFFKFGEAVFFVAYRGGKPVGRICAHINRRHLEQYRDATGHFGFFDCIDDAPAARALIDAAANWLREKGMRRMVGPYNFSLNDECGCLVDGFDTPPAILMPHARRWTGGLLEQAGLAKEMDLFVYRAKPQIPPRLEKLARRARSFGDIALRPFDMRRYGQEIELLVDIFNDAWSGNWGFVPFDRAEIDALAAELKPFFRNEYGRFMLINGEPAGVIVTLPDLNGIIKPFGGGLLPFNWAKLIWALKRENWHSARVPLMGLRRRWHATHQAGGLLALMVQSMVAQAKARYHLDWVEFSWVLEINKPMNALGKMLAGAPVKTYRIYGKAI